MENFISDYDEACAKLGKSNALPDVSTFDECLHKHLIATHKLSRIIEYNNDGWKANTADTSQRKHWPVFTVKPDKDRPSGFGLAFAGYGYAGSAATLGARLACVSEELAEFMGKNCAGLYVDLHA